jgi:hypothetical protein
MSSAIFIRHFQSDVSTNIIQQVGRD